jgi:hypothetical protein
MDLQFVASLHAPYLRIRFFISTSVNMTFFQLDCFFVNMGAFFARKIMRISPAISAVKIHSGRKVRPFEKPGEKSSEK